MSRVYTTAYGAAAWGTTRAITACMRPPPCGPAAAVALASARARSAAGDCGSTSPIHCACERDSALHAEPHNLRLDLSRFTAGLLERARASCSRGSVAHVRRRASSGGAGEPCPGVPNLGNVMLAAFDMRKGKAGMFLAVCCLRWVSQRRLPPPAHQQERSYIKFWLALANLFTGLGCVRGGSSAEPL